MGLGRRNLWEEATSPIAGIVRSSKRGVCVCVCASVCISVCVCVRACVSSMKEEGISPAEKEAALGIAESPGRLREVQTWKRR